MNTVVVTVGCGCTIIVLPVCGQMVLICLSEEGIGKPRNIWMCLHGSISEPPGANIFYNFVAGIQFI